MILNETPVRTAKNFNINNIKLDNFSMPQKIEPFSNVILSKNGKKVKIEEKTDSINLVYGLGKDFLCQVKENANQKLKITIDENKKEDLQIDFEFNNKNKMLVEDIQIVANKNSKLTIIIKYTSNEQIENYHNGIIRVNAKENANVNIIFVNFMNSISNNFIAIENTLEQNAKINYCIVDFGGKNSITNYYSNLLKDNSENKINCIYLGKNDELFDLNYIAELRGKKTNVEIEVQGALTDNAKKHFKGTIDFKKGAKKAKGNENENCMLLTDTAKSIALPMLLCSEEDVEGNHSSSAGKVSEKELFYIMSRGFTKKEAMKLMVRARFNKILECIENEELKNEILNKIDERLD